MKDEIGAGRGTLLFGLFKNKEMDWLFRRVLLAVGEKGAEIGECLAAARKIRDGNTADWIAAWAELGQRVDGIAQNCLEKGHLISAREAFLRATTYFRAAEYMCVPDHPQFDELWEKSRNAFHQACKLFEPAIQPVEVGFEGCKLPGYFWPATDTGEERPTLFNCGGNDDSGEENFFFTAFAAHRRGYNFFSFEYPGHRGAVHLYPGRMLKRADQEKPFAAAFDLLETLPGVDERIAMIGFSHGGYVCSRVAIHEPRVAALIPTTPLVDSGEASRAVFGPLIKGVPSFMLDKIFDKKLGPDSVGGSLLRYTLWTLGFSKLSEMIGSPPRFVIRGEEYKITCPTLTLLGAGEGQVLADQAREFHENISSKIKKFKEFTVDEDGSDDHCQLDNRDRANQYMFDWLDEVFGFKGPDNLALI